MSRFLASLFALTLILASCTQPPPKEGGESSSSGSSSNVAEDVPAKKLRINLAASPSSIDPALGQVIAENMVAHGLMEPLVWLDKDLIAQPGAAEAWKHNADYTIWTFNLREDAKWHNGDPVKASDFKFAVERVCTKDVGAKYAQIVYSFLKGGEDYYNAGGLENDLHLESVRAIDDYTIQYELANPSPFFLQMLAWVSWLPVHEGVVKEYGDDWTNPENYVGNGPFKLAAYYPRDRFELTKSEHYWDRDNIYWDDVILYMVEEENTEEKAFRQGDIDVTEGIAVAQILYWKDKPEYRDVPALGTYMVTFNNQAPPFDDVRVRKAFSKVIDRKLIVERIMRAGEKPSEGFVPHGMPSAEVGKTFRQTAGDFIGDVDVEEARRLMAEAGFGPGGKPLPPIEYSYNTSETHKVIAEQMQYMWKEAFGVDVRLQNSEFGVLTANIISGDFQFARSSWFADFPDPLNFLEIYHSQNSKNGAHYNNPKYDALIEQARAEIDQLKRNDLFVQAEKILIEEDAVIAPIFTYNYNFLVRTDIEGLYRNSMGNMTYPRSRRVTE